jgi:hypothetical protein
MDPIIVSRSEPFIRSFIAYSASIIDWESLPGIVLVDTGSIFTPENRNRSHVGDIESYAKSGLHSVIMLTAGNEQHLKQADRDFSRIIALPSVGSVDILRFDLIPQEYAKTRPKP